MKGILLAGGTGSRLRPLTHVLNKHLLPVYDKPMIYYSLSGLMLAGIREILIISSPRDIPQFQALLGTGQQWGLKFSYATQAEPWGVAQALLIAEDFLNGSAAALALADNLFYGQSLSPKLRDAAQLNSGAKVFACEVKDPERFGVVEFSADGKVISLEEKPEIPRSNFAVGGLYFYDSTAVERVKNLHPSARGEIEITDLNQSYLDDDALGCERLGRGYLWADVGTPESLLKTSNLIEALETSQGFKIACLEEIAFHQGWITAEQVKSASEQNANTPYGSYLKSLLTNP